MLIIKNEYDKYTTKTFRIPDEISNILESLAKEHNTSVNKVVIQCLEYALNDTDTNSANR